MKSGCLPISGRCILVVTVGVGESHNSVCGVAQLSGCGVAQFSGCGVAQFSVCGVAQLSG
jgi:hypothetical protein